MNRTSAGWIGRGTPPGHLNTYSSRSPRQIPEQSDRNLSDLWWSESVPSCHGSSGDTIPNCLGEFREIRIRQASRLGSDRLARLEPLALSASGHEGMVNR